MKRRAFPKDISPDNFKLLEGQINIGASKISESKKPCAGVNDCRRSLETEKTSKGSSSRKATSNLDPSAPDASSASKENPLFAVRLDLQTLDARLETYATWQPDHVQHPRAWAEAGFFYRGDRDEVRCFCCGGRLEELEAEDDPWTEHAVHFPNCDFLQCQKGEEYVDNVRKLHPLEEGPFPEVPESLHRNYDLEWEVKRLIKRSEELCNDVLETLRIGNDPERREELRQISFELGRREGELHEKIGHDERLEWLKELIVDESFRRVEGLLRCKMHEEHAHCTDASDPCVLRRVLEAIDGAVAVNLESPITKEIISETHLLVTALICQLAAIDPLLKCTLELKGSTSNGLQTGRIDELDFLLRMEEIILKEEDGWQVVTDSTYFKLAGQHREDAVGCHGSHQFVLSSATPEGQDGQRQKLSHLLEDVQSTGESDMLAPTENLSVFLSGKLIKACVRSALLRAVTQVRCTTRSVCTRESAVVTGHEGSDSASSGIGSGASSNAVSAVAYQCKTQGSEVKFSFDKFDGVLLYFPAGANYSVKLDITPSIAFQRRDNTVRWFVPKGKGFNNWCVVNEDPQELDNAAVRQAVRVIKSLRDTNEAPSSVYSKYLYWIIEKNVDTFSTLREVSYHVTEHCAETITRPVDSVIPSYGIVGTVVKCFRQNPHQSLCILVLNALLHFQFIAPDRTALCRYSEDDDSAGEMMTSCFRALLPLQHAEQVTKILPRWYIPAPRCLAQNLQEAYRPVHTLLKRTTASPQESTTEVQGLVSSFSVTSEKVQGVWKVYCINKKTFIESLLQPIPLAYVLLRELLSELENKESDDVYVAVYAFASEFAEVSETSFLNLSETSFGGLLEALPIPEFRCEIMNFNPSQQI